MPIDARIPMSVQQLDLGQIYSQVENIKMAKARSELMGKQQENVEYDMDRKKQMDSMVDAYTFGMENLDQYLTPGIENDPERQQRVLNSLMLRKQYRGENGLSIAGITEEALKDAQAGNWVDLTAKWMMFKDTTMPSLGLVQPPVQPEHIKPEWRKKVLEDGTEVDEPLDPRTGQLMPGWQERTTKLAPTETKTPKYEMVNGTPIAIDGPGAGKPLPGWEGIEVPPDTAKSLESEEGFRKEIDQKLKPFYDQSRSFELIKAAANDPSPAGDMALIFNFMKLLDPGSTVRESEYESAKAAASLWKRAEAEYQRLTNGKLLAPEQRSDFLSRSNKLWAAAVTEAAKYADVYTDIAKKAGVDVGSVIAGYTIRSGASSINIPPEEMAAYNAWKGKRKYE